jgi:hypothetical protein
VTMMSPLPVPSWVQRQKAFRCGVASRTSTKME